MASARVIPRVVTRRGFGVPGLGFGTYLARHGDVTEAVTCAMDVGYRHIDTAISYDNDVDIGNALGPLFRHDKLQRKDLTITTKVPPIYMDEKDVAPAVTETLEKLQTNYVDLLLIHVPFGMINRGDGNYAPTDADGNRILDNHDYIKTWKEMEKLVRSGKVRQLGLSNFGTGQIEEIMEKGMIPPVNLQSECHAYLQQKVLREFCNKHDMILTAYSPMGAPTRPDYYQREEHVNLLEDEVVQDVAQKLGKTPGQILIRFISQLGVIPLPKSVTPRRILENYEAMFFDIPQPEFQQLCALDRNMKYFTFDWAKTHPRFPVGDF